MQRYQNNFSKAQGNSLRPVAGASVLVTTIGGAVATIYSDNGVTTTTNPLTTDANGMFAFYAADGRYSLTITSSETATVVVSDILLEDPQDGSPMVINGGTISNSSLSNITIDGIVFVGSDIAKYSRLDDNDGASLVKTIATGAGAVGRSVQDKLRETVSVKDFGAVGDGVADDTAAIQALIDQSTPGTVIEFPADHTYIVQGLKLSGTADDRTGLTYIGHGATLKLPSGVLDKNVAEITSGTDYKVIGLTFYGNKGTVTTPGTDLSYRYFNGLYIGANAGETLSRVRVECCTLQNNAYDGIMMGSGPVAPANIGPGVDHVLVEGCTFIGNEVGVSGGRQRNVSYVGNSLVDNDVYGLYADIESYGVTISSNVIRQQAGSGMDSCILVYAGTNVTIANNACVGGHHGILVMTGAFKCSVIGNILKDQSGNGITMNNSTGWLIADNNIDNPAIYGIDINTSATQGTLSGNAIISAGWDGIHLGSVSSISVSNNLTRENNGSGIFLQSSSWINILGNVCLNNNVNNADAVSSGIRMTDSTSNQIVSNRCLDSAAPGSRKQNYGLREEGTSSGNTYVSNDFSQNKTADTLYVGTNNNRVANSVNEPDINLPTGSAYLENGAAATPAFSFSADAASGMYRTGGGNVGVSVGGSLQALFQAQAGAVNFPVLRGSTTGTVTFFPEGSGADITLLVHGKGGNGGAVLGASGARAGFFGATPGLKPSITGSRGGNAALADLLTQLATLGLITDSTTA